MEIFRRLGVAGPCADAGLPRRPRRTTCLPHDLHAAMELSRIPIHSRASADTATRRPRHLVAHRGATAPHQPDLPGAGAVRARRGHARRAHPEPHAHRRVRTQDDHGVSAKGVDLDDGAHGDASSAQYLVGCDGGRSAVRKAIGASSAGTDVVGRVQSTYFRAPDLLSRSGSTRRPGPPSRSTRAAAATSTPSTAARPGCCTTTCCPTKPISTSVDRDWAIRPLLGVGDGLRVRDALQAKTGSAAAWWPTRFRDRRVFICGDAAHLWVPMAGYGMNAGIADAMNLSWLLAAPPATAGLAEGVLAALRSRAPADHRAGVAASR